MPFWTSFTLFSFCDPTSPDLRSPSPIISPNYNPNFTFPAGDETKEAIAGNPLINARDTLADEGTSLIEEVVIIEEGSSDECESDGDGEVFIPKTPLSPCAPPTSYLPEPPNTTSNQSIPQNLPQPPSPSLTPKLHPHSILKPPPSLPPKKRTIITPPPTKPSTTKKLTFNPSATVTLVPPLKTPSDWDGVTFSTSDIWWSRPDYDLFRRTSLMLARSSGESVWSEKKKWWCQLGHSRRGLEHVVDKSEGEARQGIVRRVIKQVLEEQKQCSQHCLNPSSKARRISSTSSRYSKPSLNRARTQGINDYVAMKDILLYDDGPGLDVSVHKKLPEQEVVRMVVEVEGSPEGSPESTPTSSPKDVVESLGEDKKDRRKRISTAAKGFGQDDGARLALIVGGGI
ncbi:hypothetical protein TrLO_g4384 [Triparma laevis f. longispina]|uniref:Uncharacterized protein n=1 Tax=Triparma laevis f. longispina TaxID=1714387 RepID=A0A9W7AU78_9STRA|nr:hypothetical protein TrLO_g4384 [Triparma laevis f. longispina]